MNTHTCLYRAFNNEGVLLYIGISGDWAKRWRQHLTDHPWYYEVAHLEVKWFASRREAQVAEALALFTEYPLHNGAGTPADAIWKEQRDERLAARNAAV